MKKPSFIQQILEILYGDTLEDRQYTQEEVLSELKYMARANAQAKKQKALVIKKPKQET